MKVTEKERKQYLNSIKKQLICQTTQRNNFLDTFNDNIDAYLTDNPNADLEQLQNDMGTPQEIADGFLVNESACAIRRKMSATKWVAIGVVMALLIYASAIVYLLADAHKSNRGYAETTIINEHVIATDSDTENIMD